MTQVTNTFLWSVLNFFVDMFFLFFLFFNKLKFNVLIWSSRNSFVILFVGTFIIIHMMQWLHHVFNISHCPAYNIKPYGWGKGGTTNQSPIAGKVNGG